MTIFFDYSVSNTGNVNTTFQVGASMLSSISGIGCTLGGLVLSNAPLVERTLAPGESRHLACAFPNPESNGTYYCVSKVYNESQSVCYGGCSKSFEFTDADVEPPIDATYKATIAVSTPYRDVSAYSTVKNTGSVDETLYVGMSVVTVAGGTSCGLYNAGTFIRDLPVKTVTLSPGESVTLEFVMGDLSAYAYTSITAIGKVYSASDLHPYSCLGGDKSSVMLT